MVFIKHTRLLKIFQRKWWWVVNNQLHTFSREAVVLVISSCMPWFILFNIHITYLPKIHSVQTKSFFQPLTPSSSFITDDTLFLALNMTVSLLLLQNLQKGEKTRYLANPPRLSNFYFLAQLFHQIEFVRLEQNKNAP